MSDKTYTADQVNKIVWHLTGHELGDEDIDAMFANAEKLWEGKHESPVDRYLRILRSEEDRYRGLGVKFVKTAVVDSRQYAASREKVQESHGLRGDANDRFIAVVASTSPTSEEYAERPMDVALKSAGLMLSFISDDRGDFTQYMGFAFAKKLGQALERVADLGASHMRDDDELQEALKALQEKQP